jgi:hypothetical protein
MISLMYSKFVARAFELEFELGFGFRRPGCSPWKEEETPRE